ncbi:hypothetical protein JTE90_005114 [Oedothorax gibbosus]|uniref:Uncharacterized protein n=1 Tax=Oedothorax gibbosus TaxID=931172 RepID=A0AAV6UNI1_9ARAC|nr:hypothetical protein JTE90_005114 [Oedothorax gibbosus]
MELRMQGDACSKDLERRPRDDEVSSMMSALSSQDVEDYIHVVRGGEGNCRLEEDEATLPCDHTTPFSSWGFVAVSSLGCCLMGG